MSAYETNQSNSSLRRTIAYGQTLLDARKRNNITIAEVAKSINLTPDIVEAIERSDNERLPQPAFVQGYIRNYAKYLGVSVDRVLEDYCKAVPHSLEARLAQRADAMTETTSNTPVMRAVSIVLVVFGLAAIVYGVIDYYQEKADSMEEGNQVAKTDAAAMGEYVLPVEKHLPQEDMVSDESSEVTISTLNPSLQNEVESTASDYSDEQLVGQSDNIVSEGEDLFESEEVMEAEESSEIELQETHGIALTQSVAAGEDTIQLVTSGVSWIEIIDANEVKLYFELMQSDKTIYLQGTAPFDVFLGNAPAVNVIVNEVEVDAAEHIRTNNTARYKVTVQDSQAVFF